jgi:two-component system phosphate regulon sensor histidine kinase PhoR
MKKKIRLIWQLYPSYLLITLLALLAVSWYTSQSLRHSYRQWTQNNLKKQTILLEKHFRPYLFPLDRRQVDHLSKTVGQQIATRLTVILPSGQVVGDSNKRPESMDNHRQRPEVATSFKGEMGAAIRYSETLHQHMLYVARPILKGNEVVAVLRAALPLTVIDEELRVIKLKIFLGGIFIAALASVVCLFVSGRISRPIEIMRDSAMQFANGNFQHRVHSPGNLELASLAEAMNQMAVQIEGRMETIIRQRNEFKAVLASMVEGVIAVDLDDCILSINQSARSILGIDAGRLDGRSLQEVVRNRDLHKLVGASSLELEPVEQDILMHLHGERIVNTLCTPLCSVNEKRIGTLVILHDVTQIRHLENVRKDFVANVSHEIKTPLTAIKGFTETLHFRLVDASDDVKKFLNIIKKHVDRLNAIVDDLLVLARMEQVSPGEEIKLEKRRIRSVVDTAVQVVHGKAAAKQIEIAIHCDNTISAKIDTTLLEQALVNLIDNAVKYSPEDSRVQISANMKDRELLINVKDQGFGIPKVHLPRLFERFYRVDKARSRQLGGTGLGLAIVKHIIQAHGGRISVDSVIGRGSTFTLHIPQQLIAQ